MSENAYVERGQGYRGLDAYRVVNPDGQRFVPGRTVGIAPAHEEAPGWRAILAGYLPDGSCIVVPLTGHFGELRARRLEFHGDGGSLWLPADGQTRAECSWFEAKALALSIALALNLVGRDG